ncbi:hypothetical protein SAMN05660841_01243 [Sphingobacterium nematocida]|uniref:Outer membrane protein beta-barrel domain-containing protein n=1 Tax=Sphingobacterium nematocida TaxID=1513896 RepID=A0A1T5C972_9SPHI|nr:hypothetical protein [Sphingobacterium nematocida]SKB56112.1 hypothetical protein SAMN05660841_01243 [Sphingobacterium nematocida]
MNHILRSLFLVAALLFIGKDSFAQLDSQHALGARFGSATGINYRYTLSEDRAVEGIMSIQSNSRSNRFRVVGLYEFHKPLSGAFSWYYGFGGSIGSYTYKGYRDLQTGIEYPKDSEVALSIDGIIGVEYNIPTTPLAISLDVKPYFDFIQESSIRLIDPFGFSIRYKF